MVVPFGIANNPDALFRELFVETVETIEDKYSSLWIMTEKESERLSFQRMAGEAFQKVCPLSALTFWRPSGNAEDDVVNDIEISLRDMLRTSGLRAKMVGDVLSARLSQLIFVFVNNYC